MRADGIGKLGVRLLGVSVAGLRIHPHPRKVDGGLVKIRRMHNNCHPYYAGAGTGAARSHKYAFVDNGGNAGQGIASGGGGSGPSDQRQVAVELLQVRPAAAATTAGECVDRSSTRAEVGSRGVVVELTGGYGDSAEEAASLFMATSGGGGGGGRSSWQAAHSAPVSIPTGGHHQLHAAAGVSCSRGGGSATAVTAIQGILGGGDHHQSSTAGVNVAASSDRWDNPGHMGEDHRGGECAQGIWVSNNTHQELDARGDQWGHMADHQTRAGPAAAEMDKILSKPDRAWRALQTVPTRTAPRVLYKECLKNQALDSVNHTIDGCGEFLPEAGRDGHQESLNCVACGCHRNYHRSVMVGDDGKEEEKDRNEGAGDANGHASLSSIEAVALNLMEAASRALPLLAVDPRMRAGDLSHKERNTLLRISVENLDHIAKVTLSTAECLGILQKASTPQSASSRDRRYKSLTTPSPPLIGNPEGPLSSEVSPMSTAEKRSARPLGHYNPPPQQFHPGKTQALGASAPGSTNAMAGTGLHHQATNHTGSKPKRKRTQFTDEQRKKMQAYAEQAGWTVVGQRKETIAAACEDIGVSPKTLKYWIHNAKQKLKRYDDGFGSVP